MGAQTGPIYTQIGDIGYDPVCSQIAKIESAGRLSPNYGTPLKCRPGVIKLLQRLAEQAGENQGVSRDEHVVPHEQLRIVCGTAWRGTGRVHPVTQQTLASYVSELRNILTQLESDRTIVTVVNLGYRLSTTNVRRGGRHTGNNLISTSP